MMPRLEAEEKLAGVNVAVIGSGDMEPMARMRAIGNLQRKALGERFRAKKATKKDLGGMGIGVRMTVPVKGSEEVLSDG